MTPGGGEACHQTGTVVTGKGGLSWGDLTSRGEIALTGQTALILVSSFGHGSAVTTQGVVISWGDAI